MTKFSEVPLSDKCRVHTGIQLVSLQQRELQNYFTILYIESGLEYNTYKIKKKETTGEQPLRENNKKTTARKYELLTWNN